MNLLEMAQRYVDIQDDSSEEEYYETDKARAESVICNFLRDLNVPVWRVRFVWITDDDQRTTNHYFVLESTADAYIKDSEERWPRSPCGAPTEVTKCLTVPK